MSIKEKLVKLLCSVACESDLEGQRGSCPDRKWGKCRQVDQLDYCAVQQIADHLIENGVTILQWTPVTEGLPKDSEKYESYLVEVCESHWPTSSYDPCDAPYSTEYVDVARYDSEQKLWYIGSERIALNALLMPDDAPLNGMCILAWSEMPTIGERMANNGT